MAPVHRDEWWNTASGEDIAKAYTTARAWREREPDAERAAERIAREVRDRFGIDVTEGSATDAAEAITKAERESRASDKEKQEPSRRTGEKGEETVQFPVAPAADDAAAAARMVTRQEALAIIAAADPNATRADARSPLDDIRRWIGRDDEVDIAIMDKYPELMNDEQRDATSRARDEREKSRAEETEAATLVTTADILDRRVEEERESDRQAQDQDGPERDTVHRDAAERGMDDVSQTREDAGMAYDSAERRAELARSLEHIDNPRAVEARLRADVAQGRPATEAVAHAPAPATVAKKAARGTQLGRQVQRGDRGR